MSENREINSTLLIAIVSATGWEWCGQHKDFFDAGEGNVGGHVGMGPDVLDAIVQWARTECYQSERDQRFSDINDRTWPEGWTRCRVEVDAVGHPVYHSVQDHIDIYGEVA